MDFKTVELAGTCSAGGALTLEATENSWGYIEKIVMDYDDGDTGAVFVVHRSATVLPIEARRVLQEERAIDGGRGRDVANRAASRVMRRRSSVAEELTVLDQWCGVDIRHPATVATAAV